MILGLHGYQGVGKDTVFNIISSHYPDAVRLAFADKIKESLAALFGVSIREIDILKEEHGIFKVESESFEHSYTWRGFAQRYGTEAHRDIFGKDFWVDLILPQANREGIKSHEGKLWVITDIRFINEAERVKNLNGKIINIKRPNKNIKENHISEERLDKKFIDYEIINDSSIEVLTERVVKVVDELITFI